MLEPTPGRVTVMRIADSGRLYWDVDYRRFYLGARFASDTETNDCSEAVDAGLVALGDEDAWVRVGTLVRQMVVTQAGVAWLARAEQESQR